MIISEFGKNGGMHFGMQKQKAHSGLGFVKFLKEHFLFLKPIGKAHLTINIHD